MMYHIATSEAWSKALQNGFYQPDAFAAEGFIHACKATQIEGVLQRHFKSTKNLLVLTIDEKKLTAPHSFVYAETVNDEFPHIFGSINLDAVEAVTTLTD
jgi:uncharacterized protein (DUF952 family)